MASERVRFVGEIVAMAIADTHARAEDLAELVEVGFERDVWKAVGQWPTRGPHLADGEDGQAGRQYGPHRLRWLH